MRLWKILSLGLLVMACAITPGWAQERGGRHHGGTEFSRQLLHVLQLSDDQQAQVREAFAAYRETVQPLREDMRTTRQRFVDLLLNPNPLDPAALQTLQQHLATLQADFLQARVTLAQAIRSHLTTEQLTQATQLTGQQRALRENMRQLFTPSQP